MSIAKPDFIEGIAKGMAVLESFDTERQRLNATLAAERAGLTRAAARRDLLPEMTALGLSAFSRALFAADLPVPPRELAAAVMDINRHLASTVATRGLPSALSIGSRRRVRSARRFRCTAAGRNTSGFRGTMKQLVSSGNAVCRVGHREPWRPRPTRALRCS